LSAFPTAKTRRVHQRVLSFTSQGLSGQGLSD
jgi:hypothetical protein